MFDWLFKRPKRTIEKVPLTTESIMHSIETRRAIIAEHNAEAADRREKAMNKLMLFPLNYPVDEMEIGLTCDIEYYLLVTLMRSLLNDGSWEIVSGTRQGENGRRIQRVR